MDNGEEYAKIAEAIIEECLPIPAHRVVGKLEAALAIESAIAAERERCAKIAEAHSGCPVGGCDGEDCGKDIAAKIRSGEYFSEGHFEIGDGIKVRMPGKFRGTA